MVFMGSKPWLKHYPEQILDTLSYEEAPLQHMLLKTAEKYRIKSNSFYGERIHV